MQSAEECDDFIYMTIYLCISNMTIYLCINNMIIYYLCVYIERLSLILEVLFKIDGLTFRQLAREGFTARYP